LSEPGARLLVVEDEPVVRLALHKFLVAAGYAVDLATSLEEARTLLLATRYAVVLADLRLSAAPGADGLEVLRFAHEEAPGTQVILLTAYLAPETREAAERLGPHLFLQKPLPLAEVAAAVRRLLSTAAAGE
jgi:DNA-binding NtrC family response regulator